MNTNKLYFYIRCILCVYLFSSSDLKIDYAFFSDVFTEINDRYINSLSLDDPMDIDDFEDYNEELITQENNDNPKGIQIESFFIEDNNNFNFLSFITKKAFSKLHSPPPEV